MVITDILKLEPEDTYKKLSTEPLGKVSAEDIDKQLDPNKHDVFDESKRPKKSAKMPVVT